MEFTAQTLNVTPFYSPTFTKFGIGLEILSFLPLLFLLVTLSCIACQVILRLKGISELFDLSNGNARQKGELKRGEFRGDALVHCKMNSDEMESIVSWQSTSVLAFSMHWL